MQNQYEPSWIQNFKRAWFKISILEKWSWLVVIKIMLEQWLQFTQHRRLSDSKWCCDYVFSFLPVFKPIHIMCCLLENKWWERLFPRLASSEWECIIEWSSGNILSAVSGSNIAFFISYVYCFLLRLCIYNQSTKMKPLSKFRVWAYSKFSSEKDIRFLITTCLVIR